jgi:RNA polymerase sigma-70 factor (ECF subfamily)
LCHATPKKIVLEKTDQTCLWVIQVGLSRGILYREVVLKNPSDESLVDALQHRPAEALTVLFDRYRRLVFDVAQRILHDRGEAEDLTQDVFIEIYRKADLYDPSKGSVLTWILQYAYHRSFNRRKYLSLRSFYDASPITALAHLELSGERSGREGMSTQEWQEVLQQGMKVLNDKERQIVGMIAFEGLTVREASERMDQSYANGRNHYYRALKKLREFLCRMDAQPTREVNDVRP